MWRCAKSSRLNFSAVSENDILEGIRRIGKVIDEQISLYGTISGRPRGDASTEKPATEEMRPPNVVQFPRSADTKRGASGS